MAEEQAVGVEVAGDDYAPIDLEGFYQRMAHLNGTARYVPVTILTKQVSEAVAEAFPDLPYGAIHDKVMASNGGARG
jgi:hypothetical protein